MIRSLFNHYPQKLEEVTIQLNETNWKYLFIYLFDISKATTWLTIKLIQLKMFEISVIVIFN